MAIVKSFVKSSEAIFIKEDAIIMWPVDEMGRYSVIPSIMARMMDSIRFMWQKYQNWSSNIEKQIEIDDFNGLQKKPTHKYDQNNSSQSLQKC